MVTLKQLLEETNIKDVAFQPVVGDRHPWSYKPAFGKDYYAVNFTALEVDSSNIYAPDKYLLYDYTNVKEHTLNNLLDSYYAIEEKINKFPNEYPANRIVKSSELYNIMVTTEVLKYNILQISLKCCQQILDFNAAFVRNLKMKFENLKLIKLVENV